MTTSQRIENLSRPPDGLPSFDEYLRAVYPPPDEGDSLRSFYDQWGYEQYLIKTQKRDIEQFRILLDSEYNMVLLASISPVPQDVARWAKEHERPLVVALEEWTGFVWRKVVPGLVGVAMWRCTNGDLFVIFPNLNDGPICQPYVGPVRPEQVRFLPGETFESDEQVIALSIEIMKEATWKRD